MQDYAYVRYSYLPRNFPYRNAPNLCVFLHGGLKPDNLCALVKVADNWWGIIFPHSDNKKKSCIMLALFDPGPQPVPWLGDLRELGPLAELNAAEGLAPFPVKGSNKPSYRDLIRWKNIGF